MNEDLKEKLDSEVRKVTGEFIDGLPRMLKDRLETSVAKILGFEMDRWSGDKWKVDNCNGRNSVISSYLDERARGVAIKAASEAISDTRIEEAINEAKEGMFDYIREAALRDYRNKVGELIKAYIQTRAEEHVNELFRNLEPELNTDMDIADPNCPNDRVGAVILEHNVKRIMEENNNDS